MKSTCNTYVEEFEQSIRIFPDFDLIEWFGGDIFRFFF